MGSMRRGRCCKKQPSIIKVFWCSRWQPVRQQLMVRVGWCRPNGTIDDGSLCVFFPHSTKIKLRSPAPDTLDKAPVRRTVTGDLVSYWNMCCAQFLDKLCFNPQDNPICNPLYIHAFSLFYHFSIPWLWRIRAKCLVLVVPKSPFSVTLLHYKRGLFNFFYKHLKLELLTQFPAWNAEKTSGVGWVRGTCRPVDDWGCYRQSWPLFSICRLHVSLTDSD